MGSKLAVTAFDVKTAADPVRWPRVPLSLDDVRAAAERLVRSRPPHARPHLPHARRAHRRDSVPEGGVPPARRGVQVPRRLQHDLVPRRRRAGVAASSPTRRATTRRPCRSPPGIVGTSATILMPADTPRGEARRDAGLRRRGRHLRPLHGGSRGARRGARRRARPRARPAVRAPAGDGRPGHGRARAARGGARPRRAARPGRRRRAHRRLRDGGEGAPARASASSASSPRPATTPAGRSRPASACASPSRARSPTASRPTFPASSPSR